MQIEAADVKRKFGAQHFEEAHHVVGGLRHGIGNEVEGALTHLGVRSRAGFVPVRKPKKLPAEIVSVEYQLEYGFDTLEIHKDAITPGNKVLLIDDLLATGGTVLATIRLVEELGGVVAGIAFLVELLFLKGRTNLHAYPKVVSVLEF